MRVRGVAGHRRRESRAGRERPARAGRRRRQAGPQGASTARPRPRASSAASTRWRATGAPRTATRPRSGVRAQRVPAAGRRRSTRAFARLESALEQLDGYFVSMGRDLRAGVDLDLGPLTAARPTAWRPTTRPRTSPTTCSRARSPSSRCSTSRSRRSRSAWRRARAGRGASGPRRAWRSGSHARAGGRERQDRAGLLRGRRLHQRPTTSTCTTC